MIEPIGKKGPHDILGPGKRKDEREIVEEQEETAGSQSWKKKEIDWSFKSTQTFTSKDRLMQPIPQSKDRTKERENCTILYLSISK